MANPLAFLGFLGARGERLPDPEPVHVDLRRVCLVGAAVWLVVLLACGGVWLSTGSEQAGQWATVALAGFALGLVGMWWARARGPEARD